MMRVRTPAPFRTSSGVLGAIWILSSSLTPAISVPSAVPNAKVQNTQRKRKVAVTASPEGSQRQPADADSLAVSVDPIAPCHRQPTEQARIGDRIDAGRKRPEYRSKV